MTVPRVISPKLSRIADTVRVIALEAVERAGSGHAGLPLGCAEIGAYLYGAFLHLHSEHSNWPNRDILVLSAGHGSIWLYAFLHLLDYGISIEDLKCYRKIDSNTPSHPEFGRTVGVEASTGTDGQGVGFAVGQALALKILATKFNTDAHKLFDNKVVVLAGDGCLMEGISSEASSLAGHLALDNLILIYDSNKTCLDGLVSETFSEDIKLRYKSYGWDTFEIDGHDFTAIDTALFNLRQSQTKPVLIIANTIIGKGALQAQGTPSAHSGPLGHNYLTDLKINLGVNDSPFAIPNDVYSFFQIRMYANKQLIAQWYEAFNNWAAVNPAKACEYKTMLQRPLLDSKLRGHLEAFSLSTSQSGRSASNIIVNQLAEFLPSLYGGSADLARSDGTWLHNFSVIGSHDFTGRNIKYGVREFGMASIAAGMALTKFFTPFVGTFLTFSDYMKNAVRLTAMMQIQVIYQLTHDSFLIGEDGPTHQPIEQLASLRAIPNLMVIRPADFREVQFAWIAALNYAGPTALILSRQNLPNILGNNISFDESLGRGAYIIERESAATPEVIIFASGSEVALALQVAANLRQNSLNIRVISMPCWEIFEQQDKTYKEAILSSKLDILRISIEAGIAQGWHRYIGSDGLAISIEHFGESGSPEDLRNKFGFTAIQITTKVMMKLESSYTTLKPTNIGN